MIYDAIICLRCESEYEGDTQAFLFCDKCFHELPSDDLNHAEESYRRMYPERVREYPEDGDD